MLKKLFIALLVIGVIFAAVVQLQPAQFKISRSALYSVPPEVLHAQVNDFHNWQNWSPWAKLDPNAEISYAGPATGAGSVFTWAGNSDVGRGKMTISKSTPPDSIDIQLEFTEPFTATNLTEFTFVPVGSDTRVTWTMSGTNNFVGKAINLFIDCDKMVGTDFEKGLENLRSIVEVKGVSN